MKNTLKRALCVLLFVSMAFAATAGPSLPTAATGNTNVVFGGTAAWSNSANIEGNSADASRVFSSTVVSSDDLIGSVFGFSIPAGSTINGITFSETDSSVNDSLIFTGIKLMKAGSAVGTAKTLGTGNNLNSAGGTTTFGSSSDLWGTTWTASDINNSGFGVVMAVQGDGATIDNAKTRNWQVTITYTLPPSSSRMFQVF